MKKIGKWAGKLLVIAALLVMLLDLGIHLLARTEWFNDRLENSLKNALGREVILGPLQANLSRISVSDIQIAEQGGFGNGTFARAGHLRVRLSFLHLLRGHVRVNRITLSRVDAQLKVAADGTPSWGDWVASQETAANAPEEKADIFPFEITARRIRLEDLHVTYVDEQAPRTLDISGLTLDVKRFSLSKEFPVMLVAQFLHKAPGFERTIPITLKARVNLARLDWALATVHVQALKAYYQNSTITLSGSVENFTAPQADLKLAVRRVSSQMFPSVPPEITFDLPRADLAAKLTADPASQTLTVHRATLQAPGVELQAQGNLNYADSMTYDFSAQSTLILGEIGRWLTNLAEPYRLVGTLQNKMTATQKEATAHVTFEEIGALIPNAGRIANVNGQITARESMDFKTGNADVNLAGKLNANPFKISLQAQQTAQKITALLDVYAKEILLTSTQPATPETVQPQPAAAQEASPKAWPLPPVELKAKVQLDHLDAPYFLGKDILFTSDVEGLTPDLNQAHGTLHLVTGEGKIQDIYKLTDANPLTKVLFLSLNVTGKVFNSLNVLGVLNSLGSGVVSVVSGGDEKEDKSVKTQTVLGPDGQPVEVVVEETDKKVSGEMEYDKFDTEVNFNHGLATVKEGTFVSPMMSFRLDGTADFNSGALDMTVRAAPGRHEVDGMLPLSLKIGGTVDDPQGNMQLLGSVASMVTQTVTNNVVSRNVKKGVKSIFGLFKKKEEPPTQEETAGEEITSPNTAQ